MSTQSRVAAGVPTGGQFAASARAESGITLDIGLDPASVEASKSKDMSTWLPPGAHQIVECPDCQGDPEARGMTACRRCDNGKIRTDRYGQIPWRPDIPGVRIAFEPTRGDKNWKTGTVTAVVEEQPNYVTVIPSGSPETVSVARRHAMPLGVAEAAAKYDVMCSEIIDEAACEMHIGLEPTYEEIAAFLARIDEGYLDDIARSAKEYRSFRAGELREEGKTGPALDYNFDTSVIPEGYIDRSIEAANDAFRAQFEVVRRDHWHGYTVVYNENLGLTQTFDDTAWTEPSEQPLLPWSPPKGTPIAHVALDGTVRRVDLPGTPL